MTDPPPFLASRSLFPRYRGPWPQWSRGAGLPWYREPLAVAFRMPRIAIRVSKLVAGWLPKDSGQ